MTPSEKGELMFGLLALVLCLSIALALWIGKSSLEARAYNRATGSDVSTFDAMFIELRVQSEAKR